MRAAKVIIFGLMALYFSACASDKEQSGLAGLNDAAADLSTDAEVTYYSHIKQIVDSKCANCHEKGGFAPFNFSTYENLKRYKSIVKYAVSSELMPPWMPSNDCNDYKHNRSLETEDRKKLLKWIEDGMPKGNESEAPIVESKSSLKKFDLTIQIDKPYTPNPKDGRPDDYRCFLLEWPSEKTKYVTGFSVVPDKKDIVHHTVAFLIPPRLADKYRAMEDGGVGSGKGYTCFGGPGANNNQSENSGTSSGSVLGSFADFAAGVKWLGAWAPGSSRGDFPKGTGIKVEPGSVVVLQMHYNIYEGSSKSDRSSFQFMTADEVEKEALTIPLVNVGWVSQGQFFGPPMTIKAGDKNAYHTTTETIGEGFSFFKFLGRDIGISSKDTIEVHAVGHHMHSLGKWGRSTIKKKNSDDEQCLLDIKNWDFNWQESYDLVKPIELEFGDQVKLECGWDNSEENQPIVNGERMKSKNIAWGEGSYDEMCLGLYYITKK